MRRVLLALLDIARHLVPVVPFYAFGGRIERYAVMTVFDLSLGLVAIVATTRDASDVTVVDARSRQPWWQALAVLVLALFMAGVAAFLSIPIGMAAFIITTQPDTNWLALLTSGSLWQQVAVMSICAAARAHWTFVEHTTVGASGPARREGAPIGDLAADQRRSRADNAAQVTLIATFTALCFLLATVNGRAVALLPAAFALALAFYDARPDLARQLFPTLWREPKGLPGSQARRSGRLARQPRGR